ncbi:hypothetical protein LINPERHAP2_LOCUS3977, partial [Linum perenne]
AILRNIGDKIGTTVCIDHTTLEGNRGNFARICVEVDLSKPLLSKYRLRRRVRRIEYEGLHIICYSCGCYGHNQDTCVADKVPEENLDADVSYVNPIFGQEDGPNDRPGVVEDFGPWMLVKREARRNKNSSVARTRRPRPLSRRRRPTRQSFWSIQCYSRKGICGRRGGC